MGDIQIFPTPVRIKFEEGFLNKPAALDLHIDPAIEKEFNSRGITSAELPAGTVLAGKGNGSCELHISKKDDHAEEGYSLRITPNRIEVGCSTAAGAYYALLSLEQIFAQTPDDIPCLQISDAPLLPVRGVLLDIGRNKIPRMEVLYAIVDMLSKMKVNHLELYMQGYSFEWRQYKYLFSDETPVTAAEFRSLSEYARRHFIDLVPNQNSLGHMDEWLDKVQFRRLAECEDGFMFQNLYWRAPGTVDAKDPKAKEMITGLFDELLENSSSEYVNVNLDEPFELGKGKNRSSGGDGHDIRLYTDYVKYMNDYLRSKGKKMLMWGDVIFSHPESIGDIPEDVAVLDWLYEGDGSFEKDCRAICKTKRDFYLCPGTSNWCSFTGRSENMIKNIRNAVDCAARYGAKGIILTDWGDLGHWQYLSASFVPFAYGAGYSWSGMALSEEALLGYCDREIYGDPGGEASRTALALGNYYQFEHAPLYNTTLCFAVMASKYRFNTREEFNDRIKMMLALSRNIAKGFGAVPESDGINLDAAGLSQYLAGLEDKIKKLQLGCPDGELIKKEMLSSIRMIAHGMRLYIAMTEHAADGEQFARDMRDLYQDMGEIVQMHYQLWSVRNRQGGYAKSQEQLLHLMKVYDKHDK